MRHRVREAKSPSRFALFSHGLTLIWEGVELENRAHILIQRLRERSPRLQDPRPGAVRDQQGVILIARQLAILWEDYRLVQETQSGLLPAPSLYPIDVTRIGATITPPDCTFIHLSQIISKELALVYLTSPTP